MGKVEYHAIRCACCRIYQVQQVKKSLYFKCTRCGKHQKFLNEYFRGAARQCREIVQHLNKVYRSGEIGFSQPVQISPNDHEVTSQNTKRKSTSKAEESDNKRVKQTKSNTVNQIQKLNLETSITDAIDAKNSHNLKSDAKANVDENEDDELFSFESPQKSLTSACKFALENNTSSYVREMATSGEAETDGKLSPSTVKGPVCSVATKSVGHDNNSDEEIFDDIPTPRKARARDSQQIQKCSMELLTKKSPLKNNREHNLELARKAASFCKINNASIRKTMKNEEEEEEEEGSSLVTSTHQAPVSNTLPVTLNGASTQTYSANHSKILVDDDDDDDDDDKRTSLMNKTNLKKTKSNEDWRRRSLTKLSKFKFDLDEEDCSEKVDTKENSAVPEYDVAGREVNRAAEITTDNPQQKHSNSVIDKGALQTPKKQSEDYAAPSLSVSGRDRLLNTLQKFKLTPNSKRKF